MGRRGKRREGKLGRKRVIFSVSGRNAGHSGGIADASLVSAEEKEPRNTILKEVEMKVCP